MTKANFKSQAAANGKNVAKAENAVPERIAQLAEIIKGRSKEDMAIIRDAWKQGYSQARKQIAGVEPSKEASSKAWSKYRQAAESGATNLEGAQKRGTKKRKEDSGKKSGGVVSGAVMAANVKGGDAQRSSTTENGVLSKMQAAKIRGDLQKAQNKMVLIKPNDKVQIAALKDIAGFIDYAIKALKV